MEKYINYILENDIGPTGWLGPDDKPLDGDQYYPPTNVMVALAMYAEGFNTTRGKNYGEKWNVCTSAIFNHLMVQKERMLNVTLSEWAKARWIDTAYIAEWLIDKRVPNTSAKEESLIDLIELLHVQGSDWDSWFVNFTGDAGFHNVNNAQGLKSAAIWWRVTGNDSLHDLSRDRMINMDQRYGLPTGAIVALCGRPDASY